MNKIFSILLFCLISCLAFAQKEKAPLWEGNKYYKEHDFQKSLQAYNNALTIAPANPLANYNMGNTQFRLNNFDSAIKMYENTIDKSIKKPEREKAFYNKGVSLSKQKKLEESIDAYKSALKLDARDQEARENLQKALLEKKEKDKKKEDKKDQDKKEKEKDKDKKQEDKKDQEDKQQQDKQNKLSKQQIEQLLKSLEQKEKDLQKNIQDKENKKEKERANSSGPEKDW